MALANISGVRRVFAGSKNALGNFASFTIKFKEFLIALAVLVAFVLLMVLIIYGARVVHPRFFWVRRSEDLNKIMGSIIEDMKRVQVLYNGIRGDERMGGLRQRLDGVMRFIESKTFEDDLTLYFKYQGIFDNSIDFWLFNTIFKEFRQFSDKNDNDDGRAKLEARLGVARKAIRDLAGAMASVEAFERNVHELADDDGKKLAYVDLCVGVRTLDLYLNLYKEDLMRMHEIRRVSFFNYLVYLVKPHYERIILVEVVQRWRNAFKGENVEKRKEDFRVWWDGLYGRILGLIDEVYKSADKIIEGC